MKRANQDIRDLIEKAGVRHWEVAEVIGISPWMFSVRLRNELSEDQKEEIRAAVSMIVEARKGDQE